MNTEFHPDDVLGSFSALRREKKACARYQCDLGDLAAAPESAQVPPCLSSSFPTFEYFSHFT